MRSGRQRLLGTALIDRPVGEHLATIGDVVRTFGERTDSKAEVIGIDVDGERFIVKHTNEPEGVRWLESAVRFHAAVHHPAIAAVVHHFRTVDGGVALVEEWAPGEVLHDAYDPTVPSRDAPGSPYQRFLALPANQIVNAVRQLLDAHVAVADVGFVAVDLYEGCLVYDFDERRLHLFDLDCYQPGPYTLEVDRQLGSTATMAPEEHRRGAIIDERTTVFTLGRFAHILLGGERHGPPDRRRWRAGPERFDVMAKACALDPTDRHRSVRALAEAWAGAR